MSSATDRVGSASTQGYLALLRANPNFRHLWYGQVVSQTGDWFSLITLQTLLLNLTGSAGALAWLALCQMLPVLLLSPVAGVLVDRLNRRRVMIWTDVARAVVAFGFLLVNDREHVWLAWALAASLTALAAFFEPARTATIPNVTRREELIPANALSAVTWSIILTCGALLGGTVCALFGRQVAFLVNGASFLASAYFISRVRVAQKDSRPSARGGGLGELRQGFAYVCANSHVAALLSVKAVWGLGGGITLLVAVYGQGIFSLGPGREALSIGLLWASRGLGTALGPILGRRITGSDPHRMKWAIAQAFLVAGLFYFLLSLAGGLGTAALALILAHMGGSVAWVFSTTLLQMAVPDTFRGRVFSAEMAMMTVTTALSNFVVGQAMDRFAIGPRPMTIYLAGVFVLPGVVWVLAMLRASKRCRA